MSHDTHAALEKSAGVALVFWQNCLDAFVSPGLKKNPGCFGFFLSKARQCHCMPAARFQLAKKVLEKNESIFGHYSIITDSLQRSTFVFLVLRVQIPVFAPGHPILEQKQGDISLFDSSFDL